MPHNRSKKARTDLAINNEDMPLVTSGGPAETMKTTNGIIVNSNNRGGNDDKFSSDGTFIIFIVISIEMTTLRTFFSDLREKYTYILDTLWEVGESVEILSSNHNVAWAKHIKLEEGIPNNITGINRYFNTPSKAPRTGNGKIWATDCIRMTGGFEDFKISTLFDLQEEDIWF